VVPTDRSDQTRSNRTVSSRTVSSALRPFWRLLPWGLALGLSLALDLGVSAAPMPPDSETAAILVSAVEAASALDIYNARCRSDVSGRHTENLNKELVSKRRLTVISVLDDLFPEHDFRRAQQRLQEQFLETLRQAGGCKGAKDSGLADRLRASFKESLDAVEALP
jgi:hypothetical protein